VQTDELDSNGDHQIEKIEVHDYMLDITEELRRKIHRHGKSVL
jgi:hypothetical protein